MTRFLRCLKAISVRAVREKKACHCQALYSGRAFFSSFVLFIDQISLVLLSYHKHDNFFLTNFISDSNNNQSGKRRGIGNRECPPGWQTHQEQTEILLDSSGLSNHFWSAVYLIISLSCLSSKKPLALESWTRISNVSCIWAVEKWEDTYWCERLGRRPPPCGFWSACGWVTEFLSRWYHGVKTF